MGSKPQSFLGNFLGRSCRFGANFVFALIVSRLLYKLLVCWLQYPKVLQNLEDHITQATKDTNNHDHDEDRHTYSELLELLELSVELISAAEHACAYPAEATEGSQVLATRTWWKKGGLTTCFQGCRLGRCPSCGALSRSLRD